MAKHSANTLSISIVALVIIGVILVLGVVSWFIFKGSTADDSSKIVTSQAPAEVPTGKTYTIEMKNYIANLRPSAPLIISVGDTVTWVNHEVSIRHTVTSDVYAPLRSPTLKLDDTFSLKFTEAGTYDYHCVFHPSEKDQIIVR